jgi:carboxylesterase type B
MNATTQGFPNFGAVCLLGNNGLGVAWGPVVDGVVLPTRPSQAGVKVPSIIGSATNEGQIFTLGEYTAGVASLNQTDYDVFLKTVFGPLAATVNSTYAISKFDSVFDAISVVVTDAGYRCPAYRALLSAPPDVSVYTYRFNHTPSCSWINGLPSEALGLIGPSHTSELPFVFGLFSNLPGGGNCTLTQTEQALSLAIQTAWTSMAGTGKPGSNWPLFSANSSLGITYNDSPEVGFIDYSMCPFWDELETQAEQIAANQTVAVNGTANSGVGPAFSPLWRASSLSLLAAAVLLCSML